MSTERVDGSRGGAGNQRSQPRAAATSDRSADSSTSVLVVGVGSIGERHVRCLHRTGRASVSICETNPDLRDTIARRYEIPVATADLDTALAERPQAAVICTPADTHIALALRLARAGTHLLIEKPVGISLAGIDELRQVVAGEKLSVGVAYVTRQHPALVEMRRELLAGRFGRPVQLVAVSGQHFPLYRPAYRDIYYADHARGGGAIQDALTHMVNSAEWLLGPVTEVAADAAHQVLQGVEVEDTVHVVARHDSVQAVYSLNQHQAPNETILTVVCERGTIRFEAHRHRWGWVTEPGGEWRMEPAAAIERDDLFVRQADAFLDAIDNGGNFVCSLSDGTQTLRACLAILEAARTHTWVSVASRGPQA